MSWYHLFEFVKEGTSIESCSPDWRSEMYSKLLLCVVHVPLCPSYKVSVFQHCILYLAPLPPFLLFCFWEGLWDSLCFWKRKISFPAFPGGTLHRFFPQCSTTPGRERRPAGISSPFQALPFIPEIKYFQQSWRGGWNTRRRQGCFPSPFPKPCAGSLLESRLGPHVWYL